MNIVGIVAEYNPMHNGHVYNIKKAKELANADFCIVIMSGSFTEQGNICAINKFDRARIAIENGADMVIELPTIYSTSSSENFAKGAISILDSLGIITHLAFGSEEKDISILERTAKMYLDNRNDITNKIKNEMKKGINSGTAFSNVITEYMGQDMSSTFKPNNILAIDYLKALYSLRSNIKPVLIHRLESNHNDSVVYLESQFASSTSIRNVLWDNHVPPEEKIKKIKKVIPQNMLDYLSNNSYNTNENIWNNLRYEVLQLGINGLKEIQGVDEGLETRLYNKILNCNSYNDYTLNVKSKRYTLSRIKRICINILLNITKEKYTKLSFVKYARILKVKETSTNLISLISKNSNIPIITKITNNNLNDWDNIVKDSLTLDILSNNIANMNMINYDYTNKIKQP